MKIKLQAKALKIALSKLSAIPGGKAAGENLVKIEAEMDGITLTRISGTAILKCECEADVDKEGVAFVAFDFLNTYASRIEGDIDLFTEKANLVLESGESECKMQIVGEEFSVKPPEIEEITAWDINAGRVADILNVTYPAMIKDNSKPVVHGLVLQTLEGSLYCVGTDGRRLHALKTKVSDEENVLIPLEAVNAMSKLIQDEKREAPVSLGVGEKIMTLKTTSAFLAASISVETPPKMDRFIFGMKATSKVTVKRVALADAVKKASLVSSDIKSVTLEFTKKKLTLTTPVYAGNSFKATFDCKADSEGRVTLNSVYFADMLSVSKDEEIELSCEEGFAIFNQAQNITTVVLGTRDKPTQ